MGGEAFQRRLVHSVAVAITALYCYLSFIARILKCKASSKLNLNAHPLLCIPSDESLLM